MSIFNETGDQVTGTDLTNWKNIFEAHEACLRKASSKQWKLYGRGKPTNDVGAVEALEDCSLYLDEDNLTPLERLCRWYEVSFEFCKDDTR